jgi:hypothetical protein
MRSEHGIVNIESAAFLGCLCPACIPRGGDSGLIPKMSFEGFFLEGYWKYGFAAFERVQKFRFKNKTRDSSEIKPIRSRSIVTVVLVHSNIVIYGDADGCQIRLLGVARRRNRRKRVSNDSSMLGKPNKK